MKAFRYAQCIAALSLSNPHRLRFSSTIQFGAASTPGSAILYNTARASLTLAVFFLVTSPILILAQGENPQEPQWQLWKIGADGTGLAQLADTPGYSCGSPKWSPDGKFVAFDTRRVGEQLMQSQIAVVRADGTGLRLLCGGGMPCWSPDGTHLVYHTYDNPQSIEVIKADGTGRETITGHWGSPRWLPHGNRIASVGDNRSLAIYDLATGNEYHVASGPHSLRPGFAISPNAKQICFGEDSGGVYFASFDGFAMRVTGRPLVPQMSFCHAAWSPDGNRIVVGIGDTIFNGPNTLTDEQIGQEARQILSKFGGVSRPAVRPRYQLFVIDVANQKGPTYLTGQDEQRNNTNPDWSPNGKTIIFASQALPTQ